MVLLIINMLLPFPPNPLSCSISLPVGNLCLNGRCPPSLITHPVGGRQSVLIPYLSNTHWLEELEIRRDSGEILRTVYLLAHGGEKMHGAIKRGDAPVKNPRPSFNLLKFKFHIKIYNLMKVQNESLFAQ